MISEIKGLCLGEIYYLAMIIGIYVLVGRYKLAERDLTRALELNPDFTDARLNLDQVKADMRRGHKFNEADNFHEDT